MESKCLILDVDIVCYFYSGIFIVILCAIMTARKVNKKIIKMPHIYQNNVNGNILDLSKIQVRLLFLSQSLVNNF